MSAPSLSNVFSDVYITGNCIIGGTVTSLANPVNSLMTVLQDQKANGSNGGSASVGWQTRTLNTSVIDQIGVSLGSNQFTLPAGTYYVQISTPACQVNNHRCRLYNVTTSSTVLLGTSECAQNSNPSNMSNRSFIDAYFTNASSGTYRVDHYCNTAFATQGLGMNASSGDVEIFTTIKIIKINSGAALSQWTTAGTALVYGSGNVGIGLTNPNSILNVNVTSSLANIYSTTTGTNASLFFVNTADSRRVFVGMDGTGLFAFSTGALALGTDNTPLIFAPNYGSGEKMRILTTGYVGIGTTNPGSLLTVSGGGSFGSGYNAFTAPTGGLIVQGNVGIGTSNPGLNALQVTGNVVTSGFTSNATNTVFNFDTLTVPFVSATQVGIGTTAPNCSLDIRGVVGITNTVPYAVPNNFMRAGTLTIGDGSLNYGGGSSWNSNTAGFMMECLNTTECAIHDSGDRIASFMYYSGNKIGIGRDMGWGAIAGVGIGTTNPTAVFHVWSSTTELMTITATTGATAGGTTGKGVGCAHAGIYFDRGWLDNPSITVCNTSGTGSAAAQQGTLRIHGTNATYASYPAAGGSDFSVNVIADGTITGTSDRRSKANITSITNSLDLISKMDGKRYQRINSEGVVQDHLSQNGYKFGFIAQDLEQEGISELYNYYPEADDKTENYNVAYAVDYGSVTAILVNAVKEQQERINSLEARLAALEGSRVGA